MLAHFNNFNGEIKQALHLMEFQLDTKGPDEALSQVRKTYLQQFDCVMSSLKTVHQVYGKTSLRRSRLPKGSKLNFSTLTTITSSVDTKLSFLSSSSFLFKVSYSNVLNYITLNRFKPMLAISLTEEVTAAW
jgi:hypothetical protein